MEASIIRRDARLLRRKGFSFLDIQNRLGIKIPKSTLSYWLKDIVLPPAAQLKIKEAQRRGLIKARRGAISEKNRKRASRLAGIENTYRDLPPLLARNDVAMIALALLYLCEGGKHRTASLVFGNTDPKVIQLFLVLLRRCFSLDEKKFRCTVQGRADQDFPTLKKYWSSITEIPVERFYKPQIDKRTIGKPTRKFGYKGVCRIDYFSSDVFTTITKVTEMLTRGR